MRLMLALLIMVVSLNAISQELTLTDHSIGRFELNETKLISIQDIKESFPDYIVSHRIGEGDAGDFHVIAVSAKDGEEIFSVYSYFNELINEHSKEYVVDLLVAHSERVNDVHGISIGDNVDKVFLLVGEDAVLTANHHDNSLGKNKVFYQFKLSTESTEEVGINPESVTVDDVKRNNPKIHAMTWPSESWD